MTLLEKINNDTTKAMKSQDKFSLSVLRMLKSSIQNEAINRKEELTDNDLITVIKKQVKMRKDSQKEYETYNRQDMVADLQKEIDILSNYLPEEMSETEIRKIIEEKITELKATSVKDMGMLMKELTPLLATKADMSLVSSIVRENLK